MMGSVRDAEVTGRGASDVWKKAKRPNPTGLKIKTGLTDQMTEGQSPINENSGIQ